MRYIQIIGTQGDTDMNRFEKTAAAIRWVKNTKSGNLGQIVDSYIRTRDGKPMIEVKTIAGLKAHWEARHVVAHH